MNEKMCRCKNCKHYDPRQAANWGECREILKYDCVGIGMDYPVITSLEVCEDFGCVFFARKAVG